MGKLVRDRIPQIIAAEGRTPRVRVLNDAEFDEALLAKLLEEVAEFRAAEREARLEEAADVYEVLLTILGLQGLTAQDLEAEANRKRRDRGGFTKRLLLAMD